MRQYNYTKLTAIERLSNYANKRCNGAQILPDTEGTWSVHNICTFEQRAKIARKALLLGMTVYFDAVPYYAGTTNVMKIKPTN